MEQKTTRKAESEERGNQKEHSHGETKRGDGRKGEDVELCIDATKKGKERKETGTVSDETSTRTRGAREQDDAKSPEHRLFYKLNPVEEWKHVPKLERNDAKVTSQSTSGNDTTTIPFECGNPKIEITRGLIHLFHKSVSAENRHAQAEGPRDNDGFEGSC